MGRQHDKFMVAIREVVPEGYTVVGMDTAGVVRIAKDGRTVAVARFKEMTWELLNEHGQGLRWSGPEHDQWGGPYVEPPAMRRLASYLGRALRQLAGLPPEPVSGAVEG